MKNHAMFQRVMAMFRRAMWGWVLASIAVLGGCANTGSWQEEVKLSDGRVIVITQKRSYERVYTGHNFGDIPRESWVSLRLPDFGNREIVWHSSLTPKILNMHGNRLYLVATPPTAREFIEHGDPAPPYVGFRYEPDGWRRIPFFEIPAAIYDVNLWIESSPRNMSKHVSLADKALEIKDDEISRYDKRIDPSDKRHW